MGGFIRCVVRLIRAGQQAYARKWSFVALFVCTFVASVSVLAALDLLPETEASDDTPLVAEARTDAPAPIDKVELPVKIEISAIGLVADIVNPTTTSITALDTELLKGVVRYPTSAKLGETGNLVLFGHSSYLPIVRNQAFKTFNGIQKLVAGDIVTVYSSGTAYVYRVRSMVKESANDAGIPLAVAGRVLTLSTCDSFGAKSDRFVVTADFVESHSIAT